VDTGVHVDQQTMKELGPKLQVLVLCENCREYQKMLLQDLYLLAETADAA
jgi:hypothetical protein